MNNATKQRKPTHAELTEALRQIKRLVEKANINNHLELCAVIGGVRYWARCCSIADEVQQS